RSVHALCPLGSLGDMAPNSPQSGHALERPGCPLSASPGMLLDHCRHGNLVEKSIIHEVSVLAWRRHAGSLSSEQAWEDWPPRLACGSGASRSKFMSNRQHSAKLVLASTSRQMERRS